MLKRVLALSKQISGTYSEHIHFKTIKHDFLFDYLLVVTPLPIM